MFSRFASWKRRPSKWLIWSWRAVLFGCTKIFQKHLCCELTFWIWYIFTHACFLSLPTSPSFFRTPFSFSVCHIDKMKSNTKLSYNSPTVSNSHFVVFCSYTQNILSDFVSLFSLGTFNCQVTIYLQSESYMTALWHGAFLSIFTYLCVP